MGPFNSREIATAVWLLAFAIWAVRKSEIRRSLGGVLLTFCHWKILASVSLMLLYVVGLVASLRAIGLWHIGLLKDSVIWFFVSAMAMMFRFATADETANLFRNILRDSVKVVIVLEFLVNTYTFPVAVELVLVPLLTFIAMIDVVASMNKEHAVVARLAKGIQTGAGFIILALAIRRGVADLKTLNTVDTLRSVALAPLLSILLYPFVYIMLLISQYEQLFIRLDFGVEKPPRLKRFARRRLIMHAGLSLRRLHSIRKSHLVDLMHFRNEQDVDRFLVEASRGVQDNHKEDHNREAE